MMLGATTHLLEQFGYVSDQKVLLFVGAAGAILGGFFYMNSLRQKKRRGTVVPEEEVKTTTTTTTTTSTTIVNPFIINYADEEEYYRLAFAYCDADRSGHVTTTELKNALEWMNKNAFGGRGPRQVSYPYVNALMKKADVDSSLTLEYPEFCALMRLEKKLFLENCFAKYAEGVLSLDDTVSIFKQAGYVFNAEWLPFLKQFQEATGQIVVQQLLPLI